MTTKPDEPSVINVLRGRHPSDPTGEIFGEHHNPLPQEHEKTTNSTRWVGIDKRKLTFIGTGSYATVYGYGREVGIPVESIIIGPLERSHTFSSFEKNDLRTLHWNTVGTDCGDLDYATMCAICSKLAQDMIPLNPKDVPEIQYPVKQGTRGGGARAMSSQRQGGGRVTQGQNGGIPGRPKAGTATGNVWAIADEVRLLYPNQELRSLKKEVIVRCTSQNINPATAQVQFGKWLLSNQKGNLNNKEDTSDNDQTITDNSIKSNGFDSPEPTDDSSVTSSNPWS